MEGNVAHVLAGTQRTDDVKLKLSPFSKMLLSEPVRKGLHKAGFTYPTIIQAAAIPIGKSGLDLLVQSKSGTGKTVIFCTIVLEAYCKELTQPQSLIIAPTREIAVQIESVLNEIGRYCPGFNAVCVIGGQEVVDDRKRLQSAKAVVGTPGRIMHLIENKVLNMSQIKLLVVDEADKMYSKSFRTDLQRIQKSLPSQRQTIACSATFYDNLDEDLAKVMHNPLLISNEHKSMLLVGIKQFVYELPEQETSMLEMQSKLNSLRTIFGLIAFKQCLIFAGTQSRANSYRNYLEEDGYSCEVMSGAQDQQTRLSTFQKFRGFNIRILIATDLMSRGIDSEYTNLVINLELPNDVVTYLHRIGRAGRFGSHGIAISFVASSKDNCTMKRLINQIGSGMDVLRFPTAVETKSNQRDFWDFESHEKDCEYYGLFGKEQLAPIASQENISLSNTLGKKDSEQEVKYNSNSSIDTKTFQVDSKESAFDGLMSLAVEHCVPQLQNFTSDSHQSSLQQLPSSNTIDDASSIAADSLCSSQQDIPTFESLMELLIDSPKLKEKNKAALTPKPFCLIEDYKKNVGENASISQTASANDNDNATCIQSVATQSSVQEHTQEESIEYVAEDATSRIQTVTANEKNQATFILSVATPPNADNSMEELQNSSLNLSECFTHTESSPEIKHFPSPAHNYHNSVIPPDVVPMQDCLLAQPDKLQNLSVNVGVQLEIPPYDALNANQDNEDHSSIDSEIPVNDQQPLESDSAYEGAGVASSGFDEKTTSGSSGIDTSEADAEDSEESYNEVESSDGNNSDDDSSVGGDYEESEDDDNEKKDVECQTKEYETSDEEDTNKEFTNETKNKTEFNKSTAESEENQTNESAGNYEINNTILSAEHWNNLYIQQASYVMDYVRATKFVTAALIRNDDVSE